MTSQQLRAQLEEALDIIAKCELMFNDPVRAARDGTEAEARRAVFDFMDRYRDQAGDA